MVGGGRGDFPYTGKRLKVWSPEIKDYFCSVLSGSDQERRSIRRDGRMVYLGKQDTE